MPITLFQLFSSREKIDSISVCVVRYLYLLTVQRSHTCLDLRHYLVFSSVTYKTLIKRYFVLFCCVLPYKMTEAVAPTLPHMEVVDRLWRLPVMESAWNSSYSLYDRVKNIHGLTHLALSTAEGAVHKAVETIAPVANRFATPIHVVDMKLCQGLDMIEHHVPMVKEPPQQMYESAKELVSTKVVQPVKQVNVSSLRELSWTKANQILESRYGTMALTGLDTSSMLADSYLNYYLPEDSEDDTEDNKIHPSSECEDKVLHTAHTVGRLSNKVGRRVYRTLSQRLRNINKQNINEYLNNLTMVVQLTNYLNAVNEGVATRAAAPNGNVNPPQ